MSVRAQVSPIQGHFAATIVAIVVALAIAFAASLITEAVSDPASTAPTLWHAGRVVNQGGPPAGYGRPGGFFPSVQEQERPGGRAFAP